ncbi:XdhC family protein [Rhodoferax sp.]|jgi:xanthine dehydrogenase accessory factor|uniref:XdhC family protein n=1 Tax=Rhodoferax sp. TaxID=50421 RepID=UPI0027302E22|nr:XdhC family protein [Rhodoferax sp.]MDP2442174.1 XdhC family protein [Rhodoferax sp.]
MNRNHWIAHAARLQAEDRAFALVTVLRAQAPTSAKAGDKAIITADGQIHGWIGGGCAQPAVVKTVRQALASGQPQNIRIAPTDETAERTLGDVLEFGMACHSGGTLELFIDPVLPALQLTVFGDSPVALALTGLAPRIGLQTVLVAAGAQAGDFPDAIRVIGSDHTDTVIQALPPGGLVVVATQGRRDLPALRAALALKPQTLWFVASERKATVLRESLIGAGEDPARVAAIVAPAGEPIGAQTPEEIALAVLATVVAARRGRPARGTAVATEKPPPKFQLDLPPMEMGSCCGASAKAEAPADVAVVETAAVASVAAKKSCCGS